MRTRGAPFSLSGAPTAVVRGTNCGEVPREADAGAATVGGAGVALTRGVRARDRGGGGVRAGERTGEWALLLLPLFDRYPSSTSASPAGRPFSSFPTRRPPRLLRLLRLGRGEESPTSASLLPPKPMPIPMPMPESLPPCMRASASAGAEVRVGVWDARLPARAGDDGREAGDVEVEADARWRWSEGAGTAEDGGVREEEP
jgi:hypothetical protein